MVLQRSNLKYMSWILKSSSSKIMGYIYKEHIQSISVVSLFSSPPHSSDPTCQASRVVALYEQPTPLCTRYT